MAYEAYHSREYFKQQRTMLINGDPRALICFCIDTSLSMDEWWIEEGGLSKQGRTEFSDGHQIIKFSLDDIRPGYEHYQKIQKLNDVLVSLLSDMKNDVEICNKVAISIVTYDRNGRVKNDFLDCADIDIEACKCKVGKPDTAMGDGIRTALYQLDEMENDLRYVGKDAYTPLLVFLTDGMPTDDPSNEFAIIRERVAEEKLHIFPLGIGAGADMNQLRNMFPIGKVPPEFSQKYRMIYPKDYDAIFEEIKSHIVKKQRVMVSEGNSVQSVPAIEDVNVINNQMGEAFGFDDLMSLR